MGEQSREPVARKRCWFHTYKTIGLLGFASLSIRERCTKCGKERVVQVTP